MSIEFPLEAECCICEKYKVCATRDSDLNASICHECLPHVIHANQAMIDDLIKCGILL